MLIHAYFKYIFPLSIKFIVLPLDFIYFISFYWGLIMCQALCSVHQHRYLFISIIFIYFWTLFGCWALSEMIFDIRVNQRWLFLELSRETPRLSTIYPWQLGCCAVSCLLHSQMWLCSRCRVSRPCTCDSMEKVLPKGQFPLSLSLFFGLFSKKILH